MNNLDINTPKITPFDGIKNEEEDFYLAEKSPETGPGSNNSGKSLKYKKLKARKNFDKFAEKSREEKLE